MQISCTQGKSECAALLSCTRALPPLQRAAIALRYVDDLSIKAVASELHRSAGATVNFTGANLGLGSNQIFFNTVPTKFGSNGGILPYALVGGADFATYDAGNNSVAAFAARMPKPVWPSLNSTRF